VSWKEVTDKSITDRGKSKVFEKDKTRKNEKAIPICRPLYNSSFASRLKGARYQSVGYQWQLPMIEIDSVAP
jgi:hypothetical protein